MDLWSSDGNREVNLVRHSATSPSISAATSSSYPPPPPTPPPHPHPQAHHHIPHQQPLQHSQYPPQQPMHQQPPNPYPGYSAQPPHQQMQQQPLMHYGQQHSAPQGYYPNSMHGPPQQQQPPQQTPSGMFTRNLIGSLSASAFKLTDTDNKIGVWFILQDLSVRTEGSFRYEPHYPAKKLFLLGWFLILSCLDRLKMNFVNVGRGDGAGLNTGSAPVLASAFSEVFHVFSAKKFPGVIESTNLSKCFATQGKLRFS